MNEAPKENKLTDLIAELEDLYKAGVVTGEEYECLKFILEHTYQQEVKNGTIKPLIDVKSRVMSN